MKKTILYLFLLAICSVACTNENYLKYDDSQKDGAYIKYNDSELDSIHYEFGFQQIDKDVIEVPVKLMGMPKDYDRTFEIEMVDTLTNAVEGVHYAIDKSSLVIPKDSVGGVMKITILRWLDPMLETQEFSIGIQIKENDNIRPVGMSHIQITFQDKEPEKPEWWLDYNLGAYNFEVGQRFFTYFDETEKVDKRTHDIIENKYGKYFVAAEAVGGPLSLYDNFFARYVLTPLYNYYQENPNPNISIPKPALH